MFLTPSKTNVARAWNEKNRKRVWLGQGLGRVRAEVGQALSVCSICALGVLYLCFHWLYFQSYHVLDRICSHALCVPLQFHLCSISSWYALDYCYSLVVTSKFEIGSKYAFKRHCSSIGAPSILHPWSMGAPSMFFFMSYTGSISELYKTRI